MKEQRKGNNKKKRKERREKRKDINRDYCKDKHNNVKTRNEYYNYNIL